jgi:hypothetical protein
MADLPNPPSLGSLARLPPEVRAFVWWFLLSEYEPRLPPSSIERTQTWHNHDLIGKSLPKLPSPLTFLLTHPVIYQEIYPKLDQRSILYICVQHDKYGWYFKDNKGSGDPNLHKLYSNRFHTVHIDIYAPGKSDPGQLIQLRHKVMHLACGLAGYHSLLKNCPEIYDKPCYQTILNSCEQDNGWHRRYHEEASRLEFDFLDYGLCSWFHGSTPQRSSEALNISDLETIMSIFFYVNDLTGRKLQIRLPQGAEVLDDFRLLASRIKHRMKTTKALVFQRYQSNQPLIAEQTDTTFKLDNALDEMPGDAAAHLRRVRFKKWWCYSQPMAELHRTMFQCRDDRRWVSQPLYVRSKIERVLSPGLGEIIYLPDGKGRPAIMTNPWIEKYPNGIPGLSSTVPATKIREWEIEYEKPRKYFKPSKKLEDWARLVQQGGLPRR